MSAARGAISRSRLLRHGGSRLRLEPGASVTAWTGPERDLPPLIDPLTCGSGLSFVGATPDRCWRGDPARTRLLSPCGMVEVCDRLLTAAEPVGRALPGVALVRAVRCLDGPLDLTHQLSLASGAGTEMRWWSLNRFVFGYFVDRKVTVDGGEVSVQQAQVSSRLQADLGRWSVMTVAFDGHLPADAAAVAAVLGE
ncbi:MAG: hypothetical protein H0W56_00395 [Acidothermales bacterium]|nr:hypothetical protein [Acidothermales bacterium]